MPGDMMRESCEEFWMTQALEELLEGAEMVWEYLE